MTKDQKIERLERILEWITNYLPNKQVKEMVQDLEYALAAMEESYETKISNP